MSSTTAYVDPYKVGRRRPLGSPDEITSTPSSIYPSAPPASEMGPPYTTTSTAYTAAKDPRRSSSPLVKVLLGIVAAAACLGGFVWFRNREQEWTGRVDRVGWKYQVDMETVVAEQESGWDMPIGAEVLYTTEEVHSYREVVTHYDRECRWETTREATHEEYSHTEQTTLADGTVESKDVFRPVYEDVTREVCVDIPRSYQEPLYATRYHYRVLKWTAAAPAVLKHEGVDITEPMFPILPPNVISGPRPNQIHEGMTREVRRTAQHYAVVDGKKYETEDLNMYRYLHSHASRYCRLMTAGSRILKAHC